jgi:hypothetical protein
MGINLPWVITSGQLRWNDVAGRCRPLKENSRSIPESVILIVLLPFYPEFVIAYC